MNTDRRRSAIEEALPIYYALLLTLLTIVGLYLLVQLQHVLLILFVSVLFAATLAQPAEYLTKLKIPRFLAVIIIYLGALAIVGLIIWFVALPVLNEVSDLGNELPNYADQVEGARKAYDDLRERYPELDTFDNQISALSTRLTRDVSNRLLELPFTLFSLAFDALSVFFISILLVTNREKLRDLSLSLIHPSHRDAWENVLNKIWLRLGLYLRAKLIVMAIIGLLTYAALLLIDVRFPLLLAIIVALGETIPRVGVWFARVPLLGIAAIGGTEMVISVAIASILIENAKGYLISPIVEGDQLDIHPLLVFIAVLVGGTLMGVPGAFIAVPAAAMIQVLFEEVLLPWRVGQFGETLDAPGQPESADNAMFPKPASAAVPDPQ